MRSVYLHLLKHNLPLPYEPTPFDIRKFNDILKAFYLPAIVEQLNRKTVLEQMLEDERRRKRIELWSQKSVLKAMLQAMKGGKK